MFFFAMLILFFALTRVAGGRRHRFARVGCYNHHRGRPMRLEAARPEPTPFERLKQRYVHGDLSDEQYEDELDKLLRAGGSFSFDSTSARSVTSARSI
jgi:hypothetical protein